MLVASGLFAAGTVVAAARERAWRTMPLRDFKPDFAKTIAIADKVQPALLLVSLISTARFAFVADAGRRAAALASGLGLMVILGASAGILVPLQRRIIGSQDDDGVAEVLRLRWLRGHLARCALAAVSFSLAALAVLL